MLNGTGLRLCGILLVIGLAAAPALAGTYTTLYQFTAGSDGANPTSSVAYDEQRNLYGVTDQGGNYGPDVQCFYYGCGTLYKTSPSGQETTLVTFTGTANGRVPKGQLTLVDHTLYGAASGGGTYGYGELFSVRTNGTGFTVLHAFDDIVQHDGSSPIGPLVPGPAGSFYGIATFGGPGRSRDGYGVLYELKPDGRYIHLHNFSGTDGSQPNALIIDAAGTLYGSTTFGVSRCQGGLSCGVVFKYVPSTRTFSVVHQMVEAEGAIPMLGSVGPDGTLYGATFYGGDRYRTGSLFELVAAGGTYTYTKLYSFSPFHGPGTYPSGGPILTRYGDLIGTVAGGNAYGQGALYRFKDSKMKNLNTFPAPSDVLPPTMDTNGIIYGASSTGGINPCIYPSGISLVGGCGFVYSFAQ